MEPQRCPEPEWIGRYRILGRLGSGGMGEVFLAWDGQLKRQVAIKRIRHDIGLTPEQRKRFHREAELAASVCHPFIVQVHEVVPEENALVMEYVQGRTLAERLADGPLETSEVLRLALEIAEGLAAAHRAGLVHRDLKAANVIVTAGHAKILDFGLARPVFRTPEDPGLTQPGTVRGTPYAMSPEQVHGEEVDERSDLFSLGSLVHEMLTRRPPFQGKDPFDSMEKVVNEQPVHPLRVRLDLPAEAAWLLLWLLMKDRDQRPDNADEVIAVLKRLQAVPAGPRPVEPEETVDNLPTGAPTILELPAPFPREIPAPLVIARKEPPLRARPRVTLLVATVLLVVGAAILLLAVRSSRPLRVVVIPSDSPPDRELDLAASSVQTAVLKALVLQGISAVDPDEVTHVEGTTVQIGKAVSADQAITIELERAGGTAVVTLRQIKVPGGDVLWTNSPPLTVPLGREHGLTLANAVITQVQNAFPDHARRPGTPRLDARDEDYATFIDIQERVDTGDVRPGDLDRLEAIMGTSPRFMEARILAARIAHGLFQSRRESAYLERASAFARQARKMAPADPRPLRQELTIALTGHRLGEAEAILETLEELLPGDPGVLPLRAELAEKQDRTKEAGSLYTEAVELVPSWQNRYQLADFQARYGQIEEARAQISEIFQQDPRNVWAQGKLGEIELNYGDLAQAEQIYQNLVPSIPERALVCLGNVRRLRGNLAGAADSHRRALAVAPDHLPALINLAEVDWELGRKREAEELYRQTLDRLEQIDADRSPYYGLLKALCLARLGQPREAVGIAQALGSKAADSPGQLYQMALVYSLAGEQALALEYAKAALARGLHPRWFTGSAFQWLRESVELRPRLRSDQP